MGPGLCPQKDILLKEYRYALSRMQNDASGNDVLTSWPGGAGTLAKIPTGPVTVGGRRTRRNRKNRKQTRKNRNRKSRRVNRRC